MPVNINEGTQTAINTEVVGTSAAQVVRIDIGSGATRTNYTGNTGTLSSLSAGTVTRVEGGTVQTNLLTGTITSISNLANGSISRGTVIDIGIRHPNEWATVVSTGTTTLGTIKGSVSGSAIYITSLLITVGSASNVIVGNGGTSLPLLGTLFLNANGGVAYTPINPPLRTSAGSPLVYTQSVGGPMSIQAAGYVE